MAKKKRGGIFQIGLYGLDTNLLVVLSFIMIFGFIMIYSASYYKAGLSESFDYDSMYFLKRQVIYSMVGIVGMLIVSCIDYHIWRHLAVLGYLTSLALVLLLKVPSLRVEANGAVRWLRFGPIQFQVAEPVKLLMIIFMATLITARGRHMKSWVSMFRMILPSAVVSVLLWKISENMSTAAILLGTAVFMIYVVHPEQWKFFLCAGIVTIGVAAVIYYVKNLDPQALSAADFRFARIRAWLEPYEYETDKAFQSLQGLYAIGSGGCGERDLATVFRSWVKFRSRITIIFMRLFVRNWEFSGQD